MPARLAAVMLVPLTALVVGCGGGTDRQSQTNTATTGDIPGLVEPGTLKLATAGNYPPFAFTDEKTGKVHGYSIDIGAEIAKRLGLRLETPTVDFVAELQGLAAGRYDMADSGIWPQKERQSQFLFSLPDASSGHIAITLEKDKGRVKGLEAMDLEGLRVGVAQGSSREQWAIANKSKLKYRALRSYPGVAQAVQDLQNGGIDVIVEDPLIAYYYMKHNPGVITTVGKPVELHPLAIAIRKGHTALQQKINKVMADLLADGTIGRLQKKYWGRCLATPDDINAQPPYKEPPGCNS